MTPYIRVPQHTASATGGVRTYSVITDDALVSSTGAGAEVVDGVACVAAVAVAVSVVAVATGVINRCAAMNARASSMDIAQYWVGKVTVATRSSHRSMLKSSMVCS